MKNSNPIGPILGVWLGTLNAGTVQLRLQLRLQAGPRSTVSCALDSLDQKAFGITCTNVKVEERAVSFDVPAVHGSWSGVLSPDGKSLTGTWTQGAPLPFSLQRQEKTVEPDKAAAPNPAMPPVAIDALKSVLDNDLAAALKDGALAPTNHAGITIGVVQHGRRVIFSYGDAKDDSVYEIGSITKTFTGLILAQMVQQGTVHLEMPVRELLPLGKVAKPTSGAEITLLDLSDQHSGLPRMPDNFRPADPANPYADYDLTLLYAFIAKQGVALPPNPSFAYSNLGVGLLGQVLAGKAGTSYADLLHRQVTGPLGMRDTAIILTHEMKSRLIQGHNSDHQPAHTWDLDALAGAGGIRSTAADMLTYLEAQLHPDRLPGTVLAQPNGKTLSVAIELSHALHAEAGDGMHIALNWFHVDETGIYWHNGATGGYSAYALFNPGQDFAVVVLSNTSISADAFTDKIGAHILQRLTGEAAVSLAS